MTVELLFQDLVICPMITKSLRRAVKQSSNVIIDGRYMKLVDEDIRAELQRNISLVRSLRKLIQITKADEIIVLK